MTGPDVGGDRRASRLAVGLAVVATVVAIGSPLLGLRVFAGTDLLEGFAPWDRVAPDGEVTNPLVSDLVDSSLPDRREAVDRLRGGDLPLWQPYANGGRPLAALPNLGLASPLNWPYLLLPLWYAPAVVQLLAMVVSLAGGLAWLRRAGTGWIGATLGAVTVTFSGFAVVYAGFPAGHVTALLPVGLWAADVATDPSRRTTVRVLPLAAVVAAMWFEGFPQVTAFALAAMGAWALATVADRRGDRTGGTVDPAEDRDGHAHRARPRARALAVPAAAVVLGTMLAGVQLVPFAADAARLDLSGRAQTADDHLPAGSAVTVLAPDALGTATGDDWFGPLNELEVQSAIAVPALVLALLGLATTARRHRWRTGMVTVMAGAAAVLTWVGGPLLSLAQVTPVFALADGHRVRVLVVVGVAWLAAQGLDRVVHGPRPTRGEAGRVAALLGVAVATTAAVTRAAHRLAATPADVAAIDRGVVVALAGFAVTSAVVALALWRPAWRRAAGVGVVALALVVSLPLPARFWPRTDRALFYPTTPTHAFLEANLGHDRLLADGLTMLPGTTTWYGLRTAAAHAFPTPEWRDLLEAVDPAVYERLSPTFPAVALTPAVAASPVLDRLAVRYLVLDPDVDTWPDDPAAQLVHDASARVYERPTALPRIRWAAQAEVVTAPRARVARLASGDLDAGTVLLSAPPPEATAPHGSARVEVVRDAGDTIEVEVVAGGAGWLVVADTLDDWTAEVDGDAAPLVEADHAGGAVGLDAGTHRVVLSYTPSGWRTGAGTSAVASAVLVGVAVADRRRPGRRAT